MRFFLVVAFIVTNFLSPPPVTVNILKISFNRIKCIFSPVFIALGLPFIKIHHRRQWFLDILKIPLNIILHRAVKSRVIP